MKGSCGGGGGANFGKFKGKVGSKIFRFFFDFRVFSYERVRWRGISDTKFKGKVGSKISPFSIQIPKFTTSDPFVLFPLLVAKVQH